LGVAPIPRVVAGAVAVLALPLGLLAVDAPQLALAGIFALGFLALTAHDAAAGVAAFTILALIGHVSLLAGSPAVKVAGIVLVIALLRNHVALLRLLHDHPAVAWTAIFLVAWAVASSLWAEDSHLALGSAFRLALGVVFAFVVYAAVREPRHVRWLIAALIVGAILASLAGALQLSAGGLDSERLGGGVGDPNALASVLVPGIALATFLFFSGRSGWAKVAIAISLIAMGFALLLTGSRGGLVAFAVSVPVAVMCAGIVRRRMIVALVAVLTLGIGYYSYVASPAAAERVTSFSADGGAGRLDLWTVAGSVVEDRPFFGVGAGNFPAVEAVYVTETQNLPNAEVVVGKLVVHNTYLELLAELGPLGLLAFATIAGAALVATIKAIRLARASDERELEFFARGTLVAIFGLLVAVVFFSGEYEKHLWLMLGLGFATLSVATRTARREAAPERDSGAALHQGTRTR
jgi:O-antigen ligase